MSKVSYPNVKLNLYFNPYFIKKWKESFNWQRSPSFRIRFNLYYKKSIFASPKFNETSYLNNSGTPETELVKALSKGEIKAFNDLFQLYGNKIYRFALGYLKSVPDAEELVQDVFMKVWEKRADLKENLSFKAYVFTISFNIIRKYFIKKALTTKYFEQQIIEDIDLDTVKAIDYQSTKNLIDGLINQLPARRKMVFMMSRFEGLNVKEIANELGTSPKTVENQLGEALKFIRENLNKDNIAGLLFMMLFFS